MLIFLHIPKTAGTSVVSALQQRFDGKNIARHYPPGDIIDFSDLDSYRSKQLVVGHFSFGVIPLEMSPRWFTFIREPRKRLVSQYSFDLKYFAGRPTSNDLSASGILSNVLRWRIWYYDNCLVRMLGGFHDRIPFGGVRDEHLSAAIKNSKEFSFIGVVERYAAEMDRLSAFLGWRVPPRRENIGDPINFLVPMDELETLWHLDLRLYEIITSQTSDVS